MARKLVFGIAFSALMVGVMIWGTGWFVAEDSAHIVNAPKKTELTPEQKIRASEALKELKEAEENEDEEGTFAATQKFAAAIGGKAGAMLGMASAFVVPVHFYGRVIDQNGEGVAGARVNMVIGGGGSMAPGTGLTYFLTDDEGYFEVQAKGQGVSIISIKHDQVADVYYRNRDGVKTRGKDLEATNQYGEAYNWNSYQSKDAPFVIKVWRTEKFEKVIVKHGAYHVPVNGEAELFEHTLKASCYRDATFERPSYGDWVITLAPVDGGIQETDELYLNAAPDTGYLPEISISSKKSDQGYKYRIYPAKHYYYYAKNGSVYGSLEIAFEPFAKKDHCILMTKMKFNPNSSRNLAIRKRR
jgi:hypothetical protein